MKIELSREQIRDIMDTYLRKYSVAKPRYNAAKETLDEYPRGDKCDDFLFKKRTELKLREREVEVCEGILKSLENAKENDNE